ncbi:pentapeptide repeat-containing protein [Agarilytica rhodophyticola]|uniref:pentapeptide repeat-containing protein n=1 Tax=Agarilytica rhodophyticola TaxID=1737490 RepID=UPI000B345655|nr:pentapeptide repeat-containing protein [Agarilytica rhodophyticola]
MDKNSIIKELKKGADSWNEWRKRHIIGDLNLDGVELVGLDLDNIDFSKLSLNNAVIKNCSLKFADFISCELENAVLRDNDFTNAKLIAARLNNADLSGSILYKANLLTASTLNAKFENIDFKGHDISGLNLRNTSLAGSNLEGQKLSHIDLSHTDLENVNFKDADLSNAILSHANLTNANLQGAKLQGATFRSANLNGVDLYNTDMRSADFSSADLSYCDLREATLSNAILTKANLTGAKLWKINTHGWVISNIVCKYAFWDKPGKEKTAYRNHEFERIFAEPISIELSYPYRLTANELATLPIFVEHLEAVHWGIILRLKSISDVAGGALVKFVVEEVGIHNPSQLKTSLQNEASRIQVAQLALRTNTQLHLQLKEKVAAIREEFWPRLLELAADHEKDQVRNLTVVFMDLKGFSQWGDDELSEKLSLFRGLIKPILKKWTAGYPNMEGDSLRVTFKNVTAGLSCACMMLNVLTAAGFELRIGVELGEVAVVHNEVTEISDLEGVAVSMAARLEAAAQAGEVLVSHKVRHYADHKDLFSFIPKKVKLTKSIGDKKRGDAIDCFSVVATKALQNLS